MKKFGDRIAEARERKGLTQEKLAQRIEVSRAALSHYEKSRRQPDIDTLVKIAAELGVSVDYLLGLTNDPNPYGPDEPTEKDLEELMKKGGLMFDGEPLDEEDREDILAAMRIVWQTIQKRKQK